VKLGNRQGEVLRGLRFPPEGFFVFFFKLFKCVCVCVCVCVYVCVCVRERERERERERARESEPEHTCVREGAGFTGDRELPTVGVGN
jgi:hypothetical protein